MLCLLSLAAGTGLRIWAYRSPFDTPDSDDGTVGLMARHILHAHFTTFFLGQFYGGSQEALLTAPGFWLLGAAGSH